MEFKIETGVSKPKIQRARGGRAPIYPFNQMKIGQSFKVEYESVDRKEREKVNRKVRTAIGTFNQSHKTDPRTFSTLSVDGKAVDEHGERVEKDGKDGLRIYCEAKKDKATPVTVSSEPASVQAAAN